MQNTWKTLRGWTLVGVAGLAGSAVMPGAPNDALADGKSQGRRASAAQPAPHFTGAHQSVLRIRQNDPLPQTRGIQLGRNKSMLVELPVGLKDVVVSNPEIMDAVVQSSNRVYLIGKRTGQSNAFFYDAGGEQVLTLEVVVEYDTAPLEALLARLIPGSSIKAEILNETVILTGSVRSPIDSNRAQDLAARFIMSADAKAQERDERQNRKVINMLAVEGEQQVMLKVVVAEVNREILKQFGINIGAVINSGNFATALLTDHALPLTAAAGLGRLPIPGINTDASSSGGCAGTLCSYQSLSSAGESIYTNSGLTNSWSAGGNRVNQAIRALERDGLVKTLAEPNLTAVSGETAKFLAGGEFPFPTIDSNGSLSVVFKEFGVGVAFTPIVLSEGRISLKIETEVSELSNAGNVTVGGTSIPSITKRQAKSTVELPSGGSLALAGLIRDDIRQNIDGFPGLKDVPVIGTLFRSRDFIKKETELVVIVTPYMVKPTARQNLARPDDGLAPATDRKANFLGHLNRVYGRGQPMPDGGLKGDYGFIVE